MAHGEGKDAAALFTPLGLGDVDWLFNGRQLLAPASERTVTCVKGWLVSYCSHWLLDLCFNKRLKFRHHRLWDGLQHLSSRAVEGTI